MKTSLWVNQQPTKSSLMSPFAGATTVVLWDTFDCPIIPDDDFTKVFLITKSALEERGIISSIYGGLQFRAFIGDLTDCPDFPPFWIDKIVGDISEHLEFQRAIRFLNSRTKFNVLLAQPPPQNASASSSGEEVIDKEWLCSRLAAGEQLINKLGLGKTFDEEEPPLNQIPKPLPSHQVAKVPVPFSMPKDGDTLCLSRHMTQRARTCVFWDTRAYPLPPGLYSHDVWQNINDALSEMGYYGRVSLTAFLDDHPSPPGFTGCDDISFLKNGDRDARLWQITLHLLAAARRTSIEPVNHMLLMGDISGHMELLRTIYLLNLRFSYNVILAQPPPQNASSGQLLNKQSNPQEIATRSLTVALEWTQAQNWGLPERSISHPHQTTNRQAPIDPHNPSCFVDAAWKADSGCAGVAWRLKSPIFPHPISGSQIFEDVRSPLLAEALALRNGLSKALELDVTSITLLSDCQTLIRAINSRSQIKEIYGILQDIYSLSSFFALIYFRHIPRSQNMDTGLLAKQALQAHFVSSTSVSVMG
ncbi:hypothetical protein Bca101_062277 [Brassica carinata]